MSRAFEMIAYIIVHRDWILWGIISDARFVTIRFQEVSYGGYRFFLDEGFKGACFRMILDAILWSLFATLVDRVTATATEATGNYIDAR